MGLEENKAVVRRYIEEGLNQHDFAVIDDVLATGPEARTAHRRARTINWTASPDWHYQIEDILADGDKVVARVAASGTHQHDWPTPWGIAPATGKQITTSWIAIFRVADGKIVEQWAVSDALGQMQQLGVIPSPGQAPRS